MIREGQQTVKKRRGKGIYNKQKEILHNNKQWVSELIKPLHYQMQLEIIRKQIKLLSINWGI